MTDRITRLRRNLADVRGRIVAAARRSGRPPDEVRLVAVTKSVDDSLVQMLVENGCTDLGESRPQELWRKAAALTEPKVHWHLIGHLQRNKVERTLPLVSLIHSGDSLRLLEAMEATAARQATQAVPVLLEVNVAGNPAKHGFAPDELEGVLTLAAGWRHVDVRGLMCMAGQPGDVDEARRDFSHLRQLRDGLRTMLGSPLALGELSMGMSGDLPVAIEEGATIIRVGSALFEGLDQ